MSTHFWFVLINLGFPLSVEEEVDSTTWFAVNQEMDSESTVTHNLAHRKHDPGPACRQDNATFKSVFSASTPSSPRHRLLLTHNTGLKMLLPCLRLSRCPCAEGRAEQLRKLWKPFTEAKSIYLQRFWDPHTRYNKRRRCLTGMHQYTDLCNTVSQTSSSTPSTLQNIGPSVQSVPLIRNQIQIQSSGAQIIHRR